MRRRPVRLIRSASPRVEARNAATLSGLLRFPIMSGTRYRKELPSGLCARSGLFAIRKLVTHWRRVRAFKRSSRSPQAQYDDYCAHRMDACDLLRNVTRMSSSQQVRVVSGVTDKQVRSRRTPSSAHNGINQIADGLENVIWLPSLDELRTSAALSA